MTRTSIIYGADKYHIRRRQVSYMTQTSIILEVTDKQKSPILFSQAGWGIF